MSQANVATAKRIYEARSRWDVEAVLAGNAVAVHDIEAAIFGTTLGMSNTGQPT